MTCMHEHVPTIYWTSELVEVVAPVELVEPLVVVHVDSSRQSVDHKFQ